MTRAAVEFSMQIYKLYGANYLISLTHLFCDCEIVVSFWNNVSKFMSSRLRTNIVLRKQHMLFEFEHKGIFLFCKSITIMR